MRTRVGYAGGAHPQPTYHDMGDHTEAFAVDFDPRATSYDALLELFWASHQPTRESWSRQYMTAVFPTEDQLERARASRQRIASTLGREPSTPVVPLARFHIAEDYHQKYHLRHEAVLMRELAGYSASELVGSTVAARLNGWAAGHGRRATLAAEIESMDLSPAAAARLRELPASR